MKTITNENAFRGVLTKDFQSIGYFVAVIHGHAYQGSGLPDLQVYGRLWSGHIECKFGGGSARMNQVLVMEKIARGNVPAVIMRWRRGEVTIETAREVVLSTLQGWNEMEDPRERARYVLAALSAVAPLMSRFDETVE